MQEQKKAMSPRHFAYIPPSVKLPLDGIDSQEEERYIFFLFHFFLYLTFDEKMVIIYFPLEILFASSHCFGNTSIVWMFATS